MFTYARGGATLVNIQYDPHNEHRKDFFQGGIKKVVKSHFSTRDLHKNLFCYKFNRKMSNLKIRGVQGLPPYPLPMARI